MTNFPPRTVVTLQSRWAALILLVALLLSACSPSAPAASTPTPAEPATPAAPPTATAEPSPTAEPGKVILAFPAGSTATAVQALVAEQASAAGLNFEALADLQPGSLSPQVRVVVLLAPPANLNDLLSAAPQTQFVVVSGADLPPAANLSVIRQRPEHQVFVAGFVSSLLTTDYRVAGLLTADGPLGAGMQDAFVNGGRYFCGTCAPGWPLGVYYPQVSALPAASDGPAWQAAAVGQFDNNKAEVFFLAPEAVKPEVIAYLQGRDQFGKLVLLVGTQPPPAELSGQWAATVRFDVNAPLARLLPDLLAGTGGQVVDAALALSDVNADHLPNARKRLVDELLKELEAGRIFPFSVPLE